MHIRKGWKVHPKRMMDVNAFIVCCNIRGCLFAIINFGFHACRKMQNGKMPGDPAYGDWNERQIMAFSYNWSAIHAWCEKTHTTQPVLLNMMQSQIWVRISYKQKLHIWPDCSACSCRENQYHDRYEQSLLLWKGFLLPCIYEPHKDGLNTLIS